MAEHLGPCRSTSRSITRRSALSLREHCPGQSRRHAAARPDPDHPSLPGGADFSLFDAPGRDHQPAEESKLRRDRRRRLNAIDLFRDLDDQDLHALADRVLPIAMQPGHTLFRCGDPSESLYTLLSGSVNLIDPDSEGGWYATLNPGDSVGRLAFLTGTPHRLTAVCGTPCSLASLSRQDFERMLESSLPFTTTISRALGEPEVMRYLTEREALPAEEVRAWLARARRSLVATRHLPDAVAINRGTESFLQLARHVDKFPVFADLPREEIQQIADRLVYGLFDDGHAFFQAGEEADRLFILDSGEVELLDPEQPRRPPKPILGGQAFGELSFITGADHSVTAVARTPCRAWVLRRIDFDELLHRCSRLDRAIQDFLRRDAVASYLERKQGFSVDLAQRWVERAMKEMNGRQLLPSARSLLPEISAGGSAPLAIWVGLLMDGIPEALTIGAHVILAPLSPSLLLGLFISNYPEALSSSHGMRQQGFPKGLIIAMWSALALLIGILAALGAALFQGVSERWISLVGAMAAGAMLTVISETMLPEAYGKGGSVVGLSTILGFLTIITINSQAS